MLAVALDVVLVVLYEVLMDLRYSLGEFVDLLFVTGKLLCGLCVLFAEYVLDVVEGTLDVILVYNQGPFLLENATATV